AGLQRRGWRRDDSAVMIRVTDIGQFKQIGSLGPGHLQYGSQPRPYCGRHRHITSLLNPGVPGNADIAQLGHLFTTQAGRAAALATSNPCLLGSYTITSAAYKRTQCLLAKCSVFVGHATPAR